MKLVGLALIGSLVLGATVSGCGHSEEEWQAQLAKYNEVVQKNQAQQKQIAQLQQELDAEKKHVADLEGQLEGLGLNVNKLNAALADKGRALEQSEKSLAEMRKALAEYKQRARILEKIKGRMLALRKKLDALTKLGLNVKIRHNRMTISLPGDILFDSGKTEIKEGGKKILLQVAKAIRNDPGLLKRDFQVAGHTDNKPLKGGPYLDNWGLSLMRARQVLVFLITPTNIEPHGYGRNRVEPGGGLPKTHWSAAGYGETDPVAPNSSPDGMKRNRRVELVVMPNVEEMLDLKSIVNI